MVANIWDIKSASVHESDCVDRVNTVDVRVEWGPLVKVAMASTSVMLGTKFFVSEKCMMKSRRDSPED